MKKLLIAVVLTLAACTDERPVPVPVPAPPSDFPRCPAGSTSPDCVWPDGQPK